MTENQAIFDQLTELLEKKVRVWYGPDAPVEGVLREAPDDKDGNTRFKVGRYIKTLSTIERVEPVLSPDQDGIPGPPEGETSADDVREAAEEAHEDAKRSPADYDDGVVKGTIPKAMGACDVCGEDRLTVLLVTSITLPKVGGIIKKKKLKGAKQLKAHPSLIFFRGSDPASPQHVPQLGITCGCLVKAHRQIARIDQRMKDRMA